MSKREKRGRNSETSEIERKKERKKERNLLL